MWGIGPVGHGPAGWQLRARPRNSTACGQAAAKAMRTLAAFFVANAGCSLRRSWKRPTTKGVSKCSLSKYGFRASGVRTRASADRAETGLLPRFLSSVLNRPSQEVRRELASGERFSAVSAPGQSTGLPRKPQETCHSARRSVRRRARLVWELAERVGFEPTVQLPVLRFSRPTRSTTPAPLRVGSAHANQKALGRGVPPYNRPVRAAQRPLAVDERSGPAL